MQNSNGQKSGNISQSLHQYLNSRAFFPRDLYRVVWEITAAMEAVHRSGGLTRGAQSHRIIVGTDGHAHLGDWDEASAALSMNLEAPEVREGQNYSVLSDIFSLGALYYEIGRAHV